MNSCLFVFARSYHWHCSRRMNIRLCCQERQEAALQKGKFKFP